MSKATPQDIQDMGFAPSQFGDPDDWLAADGYLQRLLDDVAVKVSARVGATPYAAAAGVTLVRIRDAEKFFAAAELWERRAAEYDSSAMTGRSADAGYLIQREYFANAEKMRAKAEGFMQQLGATALVGGIAVGIVESGHFVQGAS